MGLPGYNYYMLLLPYPLPCYPTPSLATLSLPISYPNQSYAYIISNIGSDNIHYVNHILYYIVYSMCVIPLLVLLGVVRFEVSDLSLTYAFEVSYYSSPLSSVTLLHISLRIY